MLRSATRVLSIFHPVSWLSTACLGMISWSKFQDNEVPHPIVLKFPVHFIDTARRIMILILSPYLLSFKSDDQSKNEGNTCKNSWNLGIASDDTFNGPIPFHFVSHRTTWGDERIGFTNMLTKYSHISCFPSCFVDVYRLYIYIMLRSNHPIKQPENNPETPDASAWNIPWSFENIDSKFLGEEPIVNTKLSPHNTGELSFSSS